ncbi:hypothetical protein [Undibacterium sp.]|jgi:hypothetical protein|uniref:hypothetical protein n=1 Tax=Undibacterium sp. TaxID=1914977 RepID=UPI002BF9AF53|nr:hypothetical protein [Undibacterium sp.]HTD02387.1 hypothetical protein [Undibacterium sp.]
MNNFLKHVVLSNETMYYEFIEQPMGIAECAAIFHAGVRDEVYPAAAIRDQ